MVPASGFCLFPVYLVSGFLPQILGQAALEETSTSATCPWLLTVGLARVGSWKYLPGSCRVKTPTEPYSECVALGKRFKFSESFKGMTCKVYHIGRGM